MRRADTCGWPWHLAPAGGAGSWPRQLALPAWHPMETPVLAAIASPRRREILRLVWEEELTAGAIHRAMPDVTFGAVSLQLRSLVEAGLLESRAESRYRFYRARREALGSVGEMLERMWGDALWRLRLQAELDETRRGPRARRRGRRPRKANTP